MTLGSDEKATMDAIIKTRETALGACPSEAEIKTAKDNFAKADETCTNYHQEIGNANDAVYRAEKAKIIDDVKSDKPISKETYDEVVGDLEKSKDVNATNKDLYDALCFIK